MKNGNFVKTSALISALSFGAIAMTGCATTELLDSGSSSTRTTERNSVLVADTIVAFGKPATPLANMPSDSLVIVGEKNSYVLTQGGNEIGRLLTTLDPSYIHLTKSLDFYSANNDGRFAGSLELSYAKLKSNFNTSDYDFMLRNQGRDCTTDSDTRINAQRFCFAVPLQGAVYPAVNNLSLIQSKFRPLSHPYQVSIYTTTSQTTTSSGGNPAAKLVMLPFALAFDVVTLPIQLLSGLD